MAEQHKLSEKKFNYDEITYDKISNILDLEEKYMDILWGLFISKDFILDLKDIESEIEKNYLHLNQVWDLKNKLKIPAERLARKHIYGKLSNLILHIYPSAVSSDIAFITNDAIINLDVKTLDIIGNKNDIRNLQFENNQSSFENINLDSDSNYPNSGVRVDCQLPKEYQYMKEDLKPVLTYFLTIVYNDDKKSFELSNDSSYPAIQFKCLPNGFLSNLFENDIVQNFKTYNYFGENSELPPKFLTNDENLVKSKIDEFIKNNKDCCLIYGRQKYGVFFENIIHPYYKTKGISFFPVKRKKTNYFLEAVKNGNTSRVYNKTLEKRYNSKDKEWLGVRKYNI